MNFISNCVVKKMSPTKKLLNKYTLRLKDEPLVDFALYIETQELLGRSVATYSVEIEHRYLQNMALMPKNLPTDFTDKQLLTWINKRKTPKNRQFVEKIMTAIEDSANPLKYVDISHALSLNDAYWITNKLAEEKWRDFNLYQHPMDKVLAYVAFTGFSTKISGLRTTAELTSSGMLKKCWSNRADGVYLLKGDDFIKREDGRSQATLEYYAAQVADALGFKHIAYDLEEFHHQNGERELICTCKLFTSENIGFVDGYTYLQQQGFDLSTAILEDSLTQLRIAAAVNSPQYEDMMLFDSIIANQDRHLSNWGMLIDNNSGAFLGVAPIFDNGFSLFYGAAAADLQPAYQEAYQQSLRCKYLTLDEQARLFVAKRHLPALRRLTNFSFTRHPRFNIAEPTLKLMEQFVRQRAQKTLEIYRESK